MAPPLSLAGDGAHDVVDVIGCAPSDDVELVQAGDSKQVFD